MSENPTTLVVVGGGAAGMMAAISAARMGAAVCLLEKNEKLGRKLYITGKGRCNVTNRCTPEEILAATPRNPRFLNSAMRRTTPADVEEFFTGLGVPLKLERGNRVFPQSDRAADVIDALLLELRRCKVKILHTQATGLRCKHGAISAVLTLQGEIPCKAVILATGGISYPATGSTGDGQRMAQEVGHTLVDYVPSLVPLVSPDAGCRQMQGLSLKNVTLCVRDPKKKIVYREQGEMLFTHFGISGPLVLSASVHMRAFPWDQYNCSIDLKPALDEGQLDARLLRECEENPNQHMQTIAAHLLPRLMIPVVLERAGISPETKAHDLNRQARRRLLETLKQFTVAISRPRPITEAIVTAGGVHVGEIEPGTMASKKVTGLYFAGEMMDVDAYTGGYNLQIAWATGRAAGEGGAQFCLQAASMP